MDATDQDVKLRDAWEKTRQGDLNPYKWRMDFEAGESKHGMASGVAVSSHETLGAFRRQSTGVLDEYFDKHRVEGRAFTWLEVIQLSNEIKGTESKIRETKEPEDRDG